MITYSDLKKFLHEKYPSLPKDRICKIVMNSHLPKVVVMALKPKYAKAMYDGRKNWEFRKVPPPLFRRIYVYESAPVSKITGEVMFSESVTGCPVSVYDIVRHCKAFTKNLPGISYSDLETYAGRNLVTALRVHFCNRLDRDVEFECPAPQNFGSYLSFNLKDLEGWLNDDNV